MTEEVRQKLSWKTATLSVSVSALPQKMIANDENFKNASISCDIVTIEISSAPFLSRVLSTSTYFAAVSPPLQRIHMRRRLVAVLSLPRYLYLVECLTAGSNAHNEWLKKNLKFMSPSHFLGCHAKLFFRERLLRKNSWKFLFHRPCEVFPFFFPSPLIGKTSHKPEKCEWWDISRENLDVRVSFTLKISRFKQHNLDLL